MVAVDDVRVGVKPPAASLAGEAGFGPYGFSLTDAEWAEASRAARRGIYLRNWPVVLRGVVYLAGYLLAFGLFAEILVGGGVGGRLSAAQSALTLTAALWLGLACIVVLVLESTLAIGRAAARNRQRSPVWHVEAAPDGLWLDVPDYHMHVRWAGIAELRRLRGLVFIRLHPQGWIAVPDRVFPTEAHLRTHHDTTEVDAFIRFVQAGMETARASAATARA